MPLSDEQARSIKEQLLKQIEKLPEDQRKKIESYILSMNNEQIEEFLIKNKMLPEQKTQGPNESGNEKQTKSNACVFCSIVSKQLEALVIYEDRDYLAVLEIKPFSEGHTIIIPKKHIKDAKSLPARAFTIANKIGKHIIKKLKAESFQLTTTSEMQHAIINIIPIYKGKPLNYERKPVKHDELQQLAIKIGEVKKRGSLLKKQKAIKISNKQAEETIIKLNRRIP